MAVLDIIIPFLPICGLTLLVLLAGIAFSYWMLKREYSRMWVCPECGSKDSIELMDSEERVLMNKVDYSLRNPVRVKEINVTDQYQCKTCSHTWTRTFSKMERTRLGRNKS